MIFHYLDLTFMEQEQKTKNNVINFLVINF